MLEPSICREAVDVSRFRATVLIIILMLMGGLLVIKTTRIYDLRQLF